MSSADISRHKAAVSPGGAGPVHIQKWEEPLCSHPEPRPWLSGYVGPSTEVSLGPEGMAQL